MIEFEGKPDVKYINQQAEETYLVVGGKKKVNPELVHSGPYCVDLTAELAPRLLTRWPNLKVINNFDDTAGFGSGEVPSYGHSFIDLGNGWVVDPGWQLFLDKNQTQNPLHKFFPLPKVLVAPKPKILEELRRLGINTYWYSINWKMP